MTRLRAHILLPICLTFALVLQSLLPATLTIAAKAGYDVSAFLCSPSGTAPNQAAQDHIEELLTLVGMGAPETPEPPASEHCASCIIILAAAVNTPQQIKIPIAYSQTSDSFFPLYLVNSTSARGPPLGGRAPPSFL